MKFTDAYKEIPVYEMENAQKLIDRDWMLITASDGEKTNAMTASWAGLGELWHEHVAFIFIRPQRYTFEFTEKTDMISLAFFDEEYRNALTLCGRKSGRDSDKLTEAGLTVGKIAGVPIIEEARMIVIGRKLYADFIKEECFTDRSMLKYYETKDYHRVYVLAIEKVLVKDN